MSGPTFVVPWLPEGRTILLPGRGEVFARVHRHADTERPTLLLLHGWTASADLQFFTAYRELCEHYSVVAIDHRGHGRGLRTSQTFTLEDAADDAAALVRRLGIEHVITIGYSMGGPISMHLARRHPDLVTGMVVQATALEWRATWVERFRWKTVRLLGPVLRSWSYPRWLRYGLARLLGAGHELQQYIPWIEAEVRRSDTLAVVQAGHALSRHDARPWAGSLGTPAASLITTRDRLVRPRKQRELAEALHAFVLEIEADHVAMWESPVTYSATTLALVDHLTGRGESGQAAADMAV
ncbi:MAG: alpha/beta fold hydrolase [Ilumatobacteraceae bacterium]